MAAARRGPRAQPAAVSPDTLTPSFLKLYSESSAKLRRLVSKQCETADRSSLTGDDARLSLAVASGIVVGYTLSNVFGSGRNSGTVTPSASREDVSRVAAQYPRPKGTVYRYGTAGFRMKESLLDSTCLRMGMLATLRSLKPGYRLELW